MLKPIVYDFMTAVAEVVATELVGSVVRIAGVDTFRVVVLRVLLER